MRGLKLRYLLICTFVLLVGAAPSALGDWNVGDPNKMHYPQEPDPFGWDVCLCCQSIADDFSCTESGAITDIHFWTSWKEDIVGVVTNWDISIWSNKPGEPNVMLWHWDGQGTTSIAGPFTGTEGWVCPSAGLIQSADHYKYYQVNITNIVHPFEQQQGTIYWLVIRATVAPTPPGAVGWKTSLNSPPAQLWGAPAKWFNTTQGIWVPVLAPAVPTPVQHDMAFVITGGPVTTRLEYGDAPEGGMAYPWAGTVGAFPTCKTIGPAGWIQHNNFGAYFGPIFDFETDGDAGLCPNCFPPYDSDECFQDGDAGLIKPQPYTIDALGNVVTCPQSQGTSLGTVCTTAVWGQNIDIDVHNHMPSDTNGYVNVLIDWDQSGNWAGASSCATAAAPEHVLVNFEVPNPYDGPLSLLGPPNFLIGPNSGYVWARFSITEQPVTAPWDGSGSFEDGETEDYLLRVDKETKPPVPNLKWSQPPIEINPGLLTPLYCGWDEPSLMPVGGQPGVWKIVADDFRCLGTMPIASIHWWGSYLNWDGGEPPPIAPSAWRIGFWSNVPATTTVTYSHPEKLLWQLEIPATRVAQELVGKDYFPQRPSDTCFQYYVNLTPAEFFRQEKYLDLTRDKIFWISIVALYPAGTQAPYPWGWKTRPWSWMDDAVSIDFTGDPQPGMVLDPLAIRPLEYAGESYDVAFELDTEPNHVKWEQAYDSIRHWPHYHDEKSMAKKHVTVTKWEQQPNPQLPGLHAHDYVEASSGTYRWIVLADDWQCQGGAVTDLHWYGNYERDASGEIRGLGVKKFKLSIHNCLMATPWHLPLDPPAWEVTVPFSNTNETDTGLVNSEGCTIYRYEHYLSLPFPQEQTLWYWVDITAISSDANQPAHWRWQEANRSRSYLGHAPAAQKTESTPWQSITWPGGQDPNFSDMAFAITSKEPTADVNIIRLVADDWKCEANTPVTAAVWWGSYIGYLYEACQFTELAPLPVKPDYFLLSIWTDVPAGAPGQPYPYSHPGNKIWEYKAYDYDEVLVGYDKHPEQMPGPPREPVFRYSVRLPKTACFCQREPNTVYWFSAVAVYDQNVPNYDWGWTNHKHVYNDDAVAGKLDPTGMWVWDELHDQTGESADMSFVLFTEPGCFPCCHPDYSEWLTVGKPDCWCCPRQCHGDADCKSEGKGNFWVYGNDLNILIACWAKPLPLGPPCICADFDHKPEGKGNFRVYGNDLNILIINWGTNATPPDCLNCP